MSTRPEIKHYHIETDFEPILDNRKSQLQEEFLIKDMKVPPEVLMETAGRNIANIIQEEFKPKRVLVLLGKGNNAGDGMVAARYLYQMGITDIHTFYMFGVPGRKKRKNAAKPKKNAPLSPFDLNRKLATFQSEEDMASVNLNQFRQYCRQFDLIVDAIFGIGQIEPIPTDIYSYLNSLRRENLRLVAIDMPTGVNSEDGSFTLKGGYPLNYDMTISIHSRKKGQYQDWGVKTCGKIAIADYGYNIDYVHHLKALNGKAEQKFSQERKFRYYTKEKDFYGTRHRFNHKYHLPIISIVGGFEGMGGAGELSAMAALKSGAGIVKLFTNSPTNRHPDIMYKNINNDSFQVSDIFEKATAVVIGLGMSDDEPILEEIIKYINDENIQIPIILDAGAIHLITELRGKKGIITPHEGEMSRYMQRFDYKIPTTIRSSHMQAAYSLAMFFGSVIVLKGSPTYVYHGDVNMIDDYGGPELATPGSGDALTGLIATCVSRSENYFENTVKAVRIHAIAGRMLKESKGENGVTASEMIELFGNLTSGY